MIPLIHFNSHTVYDSACGGAWCVEVLAGFADEHLPRPWYVDISCFSHDDITPYSSDKPYYHQFCGPSSQPLAKTLAQRIASIGRIHFPYLFKTTELKQLFFLPSSSFHLFSSSPARHAKGRPFQQTQLP